jgi:hypothetical protein
LGVAVTTPAEIGNLLIETDEKIKQYADMTVWFKAQRDHWRSLLEMDQKREELQFTGPATKAKAHGIAYGGYDTTVDMWWVPAKLPLPDAVRVFDAAYDLVNARYQYLHDHLTTLMVRNKSALLEYSSTNNRYGA